MPSIIDLCRELRQRETSAEKQLWQQLRNRKYFNKKFLRQYPILAQSNIRGNIYYIADFYCHETRLVIEADGPVHLYKKDYDKNRDEVLSLLGLKTLRFTNDKIANNLAAVLNEIGRYL